MVPIIKMKNSKVRINVNMSGGRIKRAKLKGKRFVPDSFQLEKYT